MSLIRWSPNGQNVLTATSSPLFRIWETETWTCERWSNLEGRCQAACWSPDGMHLLFTTTDQHSIFHVSLNGSKLALPLVDVSEIEYVQDGGTVKVGGCIEQMIWDSTGERLAVSFRGKFCLLFQTRVKSPPFIQYYPGGEGVGAAIEDSFKVPNILLISWSHAPELRSFYVKQFGSTHGHAVQHFQGVIS